MTDALVIDAAVHPALRERDELREYLPMPWRDRYFPPPERYYYPPPADELLPDGAAARDPEQLVRRLLGESGADLVILLPLTRGLLPDADLGAAICAATNDWLAKAWLPVDPRLLGSMRVDPGEPERAVAEIERWAGHPQMVQVAVPMQAHRPYGHRSYVSVWEAAARHRLPVVVHADGGSGVDFWPTCAGFCTHYVEYAAQYPLNFAIHLFSLIAEGVFERLDDLRFVFGDGGLDMLAPLLWRFEKDWRPARAETPWVRRRPSEYVAERVRFCAHKLEGPLQASDYARWLEASDAASLSLFASNYPYRDFLDGRAAYADAPPELRRRVLGGNARELYGLAA